MKHLQEVREMRGIAADALPDDLFKSTEPVVLRGLVAHWPVVQSGLRSDRDAVDYLRSFGREANVGIWRGSAEIQGRFFYNDQLTDFNFVREMGKLDAVLDELLQIGSDISPSALYVGSTTVETCLPGFREHNDLNFGKYDPLASVWVGNRVRVAAHYDVPDNVACVAAGRRRFTLFPPDEVGNLYVGPLDLTPAGQPISLVDMVTPDFDRFPKFAKALERAQMVEMMPGDALFIPSMWWHHVEALETFNVLINYWWRQSPGHMDSPIGSLMMALLTMRDLPNAQRQAWKALFEHYIFAADEETAAHIPPNARTVLAPISEDGARQLRAQIIKRLNR